MTDDLYPVAIGIEHEGSKVIGMILRPQTRLTIISAARAKGGRVKGSNRRAIGRTEAYVHATRWHRVVLQRDRELHAERASQRAIVGAALLKIHDANDPEWPQHGVVEPTAALQVSNAKRNVVEHWYSSMRSNV